MKNIFIALMLTAGVCAVVASTMKSHVKRYEITTTGSSNGLTIPSPFGIDFRAIYVTGTDTTGLVLEVQADTYADTTYTTVIYNDSIPTRLVIDVPETWEDSTFNAIMAQFLEGRLNDVYGASNVTEK